MPGEAFPASRRIRKRSDFQRIQRDGRPFRTPHYILLILAQPGDDPVPSRLGLVATKKLGNAPARSRGKRVCREVFRRTPELVPAGFDLVVILRTGADDLSFQAAQAEWESARSAIRRHCETAQKRPTAVETGPGRPHVASTSRRPRGGSTS
jgi:ribonuclease P protein component